MLSEKMHLKLPVVAMSTGDKEGWSCLPAKARSLIGAFNNGSLCFLTSSPKSLAQAVSAQVSSP